MQFRCILSFVVERDKHTHSAQWYLGLQGGTVPIRAGDRESGRLRVFGACNVWIMNGDVLVCFTTQLNNAPCNSGMGKEGKKAPYGILHNFGE